MRLTTLPEEPFAMRLGKTQGLRDVENKVVLRSCVKKNVSLFSRYILLDKGLTSTPIQKGQRII